MIDESCDEESLNQFFIDNVGFCIFFGAFALYVALVVLTLLWRFIP
jgi:hypothetical protein